jgi:hypothetical protein
MIMSFSLYPKARFIAVSMYHPEAESNDLAFIPGQENIRFFASGSE